MISTEPERLNQITDKVSAAIQVHKALGPGLLESAYEARLAFELADYGVNIVQQKALPVVYRDVHLDCGYRLDLLVEDRIVGEMKSLATILPVHKSQLLPYLKLSGCSLGLLINFNVPMLKDGTFRLV